MSDRLHALAQQLTGKAALEECSADELRHIVKRHPYFAPAQFLLLQKFRQLNSEETEAQQQKAVLFYHDPLLFDYFISSEKFYVDEIRLLDNKQAGILDDNNTNLEENITHDEIIETAEAEDVQFAEEQTGLDNSFAKNDVVEDVIESSTVEIPATQSQEYLEEIPPGDLNEVAENKAEEVQKKEANADQFMVNKETLTEVSEPSENLSVASLPENSESTNDIKSLEKSSLINTETQLQDEKSINEITEGAQEEIQNEEILFNDDKVKVPVVKSNEEFVFEPYHTVDYFASQGIKISQEELPKDKLGKQLKSFTEWLKTMKRLPATQITASVEASAEKKVETMADRSISESNVVTEAMAEVWVKQGNREKAMEIYNKLSLLDPSKTAYFAAKIESLKNS